MGSRMIYRVGPALFATALLFAEASLSAAPAPPRVEPPTSRPASTRPTTAPAAEEDGIAPALAEFLQALGGRDDEGAYKLTTADYRKAHSLEDFKKEMDRVRSDVNVRAGRLQVALAPQPKDDQPRRALAVSPRLTARTDRRQVSLVVSLARVEGRWQVSGAELRNAQKGDPVFGDFMRTNPGARMIGLAGASRTMLRSRVTKLDDKSVTLEPIGQKDDRGEPAAARTLAIDENTKVLLGVAVRESIGPRGQTTRTYRSVPGRLADLKVGQEVMVNATPAQDRAMTITIYPAQIEPGPGL
jgi:hypothetical protein